MRFALNTIKFILNCSKKFSFFQTVRETHYMIKHYKSLSELQFSSFIINNNNKESMNSSTKSSADSKSYPNSSCPQTYENEMTKETNKIDFNQLNGYKYYQLRPSTSHSSIDFTIDQHLNDYRFSTFSSYSNGNHFYNNDYRNSAKYGCYSQNNHHLSEDQIREMITHFRKWNTTSRGKKSEDNIEFSIMTYNILSQDLLDVHSKLYQHCNESSISWPQRSSLIIRELEESNADIICLQEVHSQHFKDIIMPAMKTKGYSAIFKKKTGDKLDGCAVLYKENKFSVQKYVKLELMRRDLSSILDRDNIALIVEFKPKELVDSDTNLIVANTHLLYNPRRGDVKIAQIRLLLAEIDKIALKNKTGDDFDYHPIILCGDFNSEPNSLMYRFLHDGYTNFEGYKIGDISGQKDGLGRGKHVEEFHLKIFGVTCDSRYESVPLIKDLNTEEIANMSIQHNFKFRSVYPFFDSSKRPFVSTSNYYETALVDYIFYETKSNKLKLIGFSSLLNPEQIKQIGNIPNAYLGSDHLSLIAKFMIK